ncbi:hypothetical protein OPT61_g1904 [Boeremia exigua]|uniref:Uncharacterized protein n=1 Tax=Boeremia exigua TaxID=749465 RepID=A0ACC2INE6_9PLEO|nr:hypothetical protein OPT61_g1904 [Boeremia exigua]
MCDVSLDTVDQMVWTGAWDAPRGDSSRYISRRRKTQIQCTNGGGSPLESNSCGVECEGDGIILLLAQTRPCNSPLFTKAAPTAVSPVCSAASGRLPWHPGPATAFPVRSRARRLPCHLAHTELAAMSRPHGQQSAVCPAGQLVTSQPPIYDNS